MNTAQLARSAGQIAAPAALALIALAPLAPVFADPRYWLAVAGGVAVGAAVAILGARLRAGSLLVIGFGVVGYVAFGAVFALREFAIAGFLPSLATLRDLMLTVVFGWKQLLTVSVPVSGFDHLYGVPYLVALTVTAIAVSLGIRTSSPGLPVLALAGALVFAIGFGESQGLLPGVVGAAFAVLALGWAAWRRSLRRTDSLLTSADELRRAAIRTTALATAILLAIGAAASVGSSALGSSWDRSTLREEVIPPLELHDFASPLMSFRKYVVDEKDVLFRVSGLPQGAAIRLATLDLYDGIVYQVSGAGGPGSGVFQRVGRSLPGAAAGSPAGEPVSVRVQIDGLRGVWVPDAGYLTGVEFTGSRADDLRSGLHYNAATGTALQTAGVMAGDSYTFTANLAGTAADRLPADAALAKVTVPAPGMSPDALQTILDDALQAEVTPPAQQVAAIAGYLHDKGFFSNGQGPDPVPSRPGHGLRRLSDMLEQTQLIGDDEQYAVVMALMLARIGVPARVVMGFRPEAAAVGGEVAVTGKDVRAWVEVPFDGYGWVAYSARPEKKPEQQTPETRKRPRPQVPQPPLPPQEPADLPPQPPDAEAGDENRGPDLAWLWLTLRIGGITLGALALILGPGLVMLMAKSRRRGRRRGAELTPDQVSGGWAEIVDTATDVGMRVTPAGTRREHAVELSTRYPDLQLTTLAARADVAVFAAGSPSTAEAEAYWADVDTARQRIATQVGWRQRLRQFFAPASVLEPLRASVAARRPRWRWWR